MESDLQSVARHGLDTGQPLSNGTREMGKVARLPVGMQYAKYDQQRLAVGPKLLNRVKTAARHFLLNQDWK